MNLISQILAHEILDTDSIGRFIKLEISWILSNITYGDESIIEIILNQN